MASIFRRGRGEGKLQSDVSSETKAAVHDGPVVLSPRVLSCKPDQNVPRRNSYGDISAKQALVQLLQHY